MRPIGRWGVFFWIWLCAVPAWAGFPHLMSFQGRLDDASGVPLPNGDYSVTFRLYDEPEIGILLWNETQTVTTSNGITMAMKIIRMADEALPPSLPGNRLGRNFCRLRENESPMRRETCMPPTRLRAT